MFSLIKSRKTLFITALLLLSSAAQPAFALGCLSETGDTGAQECAEACSPSLIFGPLAYLFCF